MRYVSLIVVLAFAAGVFLAPGSDVPQPAPAVGVEEPPVAVCAIEEGSGRTTEVAILSTVVGPTRLTLFSSGSTTGTIGQRTGASGSVRIPVVDVAAVGTVGGLVEMPGPNSAAGVLVLGAESMSVESCATVPTSLSYITGGSTIADRTFVLHLMNPYAGEAVVELVVQSEAGIESNERFESVVVPARSSTIVNFTALLPGRETLSIGIETQRGRVLGVGRQSIDGESAVWKAVEGSQDWFLPIPGGPGPKLLLIGTPSNSQIEYQVDLYGPDGLEEAFESGTLGPRGVNRVDLAAITDETAGVRVISTGPVVATLWIDSQFGLAATTGGTVEATRWFLPGAGSPPNRSATAIILGVGIEDGAVSIRPLNSGMPTLTFDLPADGVIEVALVASDGYLIESSQPMIAMWAGQGGGTRFAAMGVPILDG